MEIQDTVEAKQLIKLDEKFLNVAKTVYTFRNNVKALKVCKKLVNIEISAIKKSKKPITSEQLDKILWRYIDLGNTVKFLVKTKNISEINKCCIYIEKTILVTESELAELKGVSAVNNISATSQKIVNAIGDTAQKIGDAVTEKIDGLKKMFVGEENSKSE